MYKHILVPTDGSALSLKAAREGAQLAKALGARITALYVIPPYTPPYASDGIYVPVMFSEEDYLSGMRSHASKALARAATIVAKHQVPCEQESLVFRTPWEGIIKAASKRKCDLIVMSSHGRSGISGVVLGSQANRILTHSKIPVLVCR